MKMTITMARFKRKIAYFIIMLALPLVALYACGNSLQNIPITKPLLLSADSFEIKIKQQHNPQIVDTRLAEEFVINHLNNAININTENADYITAINKLSKMQPVFIYAIGNNRSILLAKELIANGYEDVYILNGGIGGWIGNGKPVYTIAKNTFSTSDFKKIITENKLVLLDLHTRYCPGCRKLQPVIDSVTTAHVTDVKAVKIDVYDNPVIAGTFKADAIPTIIIYKNGKVI